MGSAQLRLLTRNLNLPVSGGRAQSSSSMPRLGKRGPGPPAAKRRWRIRCRDLPRRTLIEAVPHLIMIFKYRPARPARPASERQPGQGQPERRKTAGAASQPEI